MQAALGSTFPWELGELQAAGLACIAPEDPRSESLTEGGRAARDRFGAAGEANIQAARAGFCALRGGSA